VLVESNYFPVIHKIIRYFLDNPLVTFLVAMTFLIGGLITAPFSWDSGLLPKSPVSVDAIPDIGENQQIVFTSWPGRSPQDIEDQITYPLTVALMGLPGVKSVRSSSMFGFSSIYLIFSDEVDYYWSRSRILEKLNSLPSGTLPEGVQPMLGPDATGLGQVFWYTIEGRDSLGNGTGGWDLHEIRTVQDFLVKYALNSVEGVSEVSSIGGYVKEYQVDVDPEALKNANVSLEKVIEAVKNSNRDVGAKTIEINRAEYVVRGLGAIQSIEDVEMAVVAVNQNIPIHVRDVAKVSVGPAVRRGVLDKEGAEVVGGVVVARYGSNPLHVIDEVKSKIEQIEGSLPQKRLADGTMSQLTIVPFYDRSQLIHETLGTLEEALTLEILITILVVVVMVLNLQASILISGLLPLSVLMVFMAMKAYHIDANIVALSGIVIAIGTMVDLGIVLSENMLRHLREGEAGQSIADRIFSATSEVSSAIVAAVATTIVSFIPVFTLQEAEGKLFHPLAYTKTFALMAALVVSLFILPAFAKWIFGWDRKTSTGRWIAWVAIVLGVVLIFETHYWAGVTLLAFGIAGVFVPRVKNPHWIFQNYGVVITVFSVTWLLTQSWLPLGAGNSFALNYLFVILLIGVVLGGFYILVHFYENILNWVLDNKRTFLFIPTIVIIFGVVIWLGFSKVFGWIPQSMKTNSIYSELHHAFPGIGKEFMPSLDEGSFLYMPTSMAHAGVEQNKEVLQYLDRAAASIPEIETAVGKMGRVESALDPAPISMYENVIQYKPEYVVDEKGHRLRFTVNEKGEFALKSGEYAEAEIIRQQKMQGELVLDSRGIPFRNWREHIRTPDDIWNEIVEKSEYPGVTSAPKLQPIETRLIMLQTGMRSPLGIKVYGPDIETIEHFGQQLEKVLQTVPSVKKEAVFAERTVGKPYLELRINREKISRFGLSVQKVQQVIETAIGGMPLTTTIEGRERYAVRVRYPRELRDTPEAIGEMLISTSTGAQIPLQEVVDIQYVRGPQMIKSENTFLVGYVLFDKMEGESEVEVVELARKYIENEIAMGKLKIPSGVSYSFAGSYENQVRAEKRLAFIIPIVLLVIFLILYFQFRSVSTSLMVFTGVAMAFSGGFILLWLYGWNHFLDFSFFGANMRELFQIHEVNLSVAVWVGFIALFGIATDDGVLIGTYLDQSFAKNRPKSVAEIRKSVIQGGLRRIRPAAMTSATTIIALLPVLTSYGRGSDIMIPMAIPAFGGMLVASITYFLVPVLYSWREERRILTTNENEQTIV
jgi:Cu(I)/Ag(I) efflux system membrane protein CusA/SilA